MGARILSLEIRFESDIVALRQRARQTSSLLGFDTMDQARVCTAVSEIARNALQHGGGGKVEFSVESDAKNGGALLVVTVSDRGPGIEDVPAALRGQAGTSRGPGAPPALGIVSARRLMDAFRIESAPGQGTVVTLTKRFPRQSKAPGARELAKIARELTRQDPQDPFEEIRQQNQELSRMMEEVRARQEELLRLNQELEDTNRGVVALYAELDEKAHHLRRADELKSRFLSNMSHEFRTPLNSIIALCRILLEQIDGQLNEEQLKQLRFVLKNAQDLSELVNDLLDLAKVEAGRITVQPAKMDVNNLFAALRGMFRPLLVNPALSLVFEDVPNLSGMYSDEGKISQILRNFISNALKFTERGEVRVSARLGEDEKTVVFSVADTGIGIPLEYHERVFEEFLQIDHPLQKKVKGTGLGLPLTRKLAELLGGHVSMQSKPGAGSTFSATIPLRYRSKAEEAAGTVVPAEPDSTRYPVLVVEDDPDTLLLYEKYLKGTPFQMLAARTTADARMILDEVRPAAVVLDILLPGNDAWDFLIELKRAERSRSIPIYVVSVLQEMEKGMALGADDYCVKPMDRKWLLEKLRRLARAGTVKKVLIVDDDEVSRYLLKGLLANTRYTVIEAADGAQGLRYAREQHPDAIFLDLVMPEMSGFEVLEQLKSDPDTGDIPIIIMTGKTLDESERSFLTTRAVTVLSKESGSREEAIARVRDALLRSEAAQGKSNGK